MSQQALGSNKEPFPLFVKVPEKIQFELSSKYYRKSEGAGDQILFIHNICQLFHIRRYILVDWLVEVAIMKVNVSHCFFYLTFILVSFFSSS